MAQRRPAETWRKKRFFRDMTGVCFEAPSASNGKRFRGCWHYSLLFGGRELPRFVVGVRYDGGSYGLEGGEEGAGEQVAAQAI